MRILFLIVNFQNGYGVSLVVKKQVEGLLARGVNDVFIAAHNISPEYIQNNLNVLHIGTDYHSVEETIQKVIPDIIIVHTPPYFAHENHFQVSLM
jgi:hypothetical protein